MRWLEFVVVSGVYLLVLAGYYWGTQPLLNAPPSEEPRPWIGALMLVAAYGYSLAQVLWVRSVGWGGALLLPLLLYALLIVGAAACALFGTRSPVQPTSDGYFIALYGLLNVLGSTLSAASRAQFFDS